MIPDNGGSAFPCNSLDPAYMPTPGMSLRDWFAGQALNACVEYQTKHVDRPKQWIGFEDKEEDLDTSVAGYMAMQAYTIADAMLKERAKER